MKAMDEVYNEASVPIDLIHPGYMWKGHGCYFPLILLSFSGCPSVPTVCIASVMCAVVYVERDSRRDRGYSFR